MNDRIIGRQMITSDAQNNQIYAHPAPLHHFLVLVMMLLVHRFTKNAPAPSRRLLSTGDREYEQLWVHNCVLNANNLHEVNMQ